MIVCTDVVSEAKDHIVNHSLFLAFQRKLWLNGAWYHVERWRGRRRGAAKAALWSRGNAQRPVFVKRAQHRRVR